MEDSNKAKDKEELIIKIKEVFLIYDLVRSSSKNIDEFNLLKIFITRDIKKKSLPDVFLSYKSKSYFPMHNFNKKTHYFIELMKKIFSYDYIPLIANPQLVMLHYLVKMFHKDTSQNIQELKHKFYIFLATVVKEYPYYSSLLENIGLLKKNPKFEYI